jgi:anti-sigma B factor antagonist
VTASWPRISSGQFFTAFAGVFGYIGKEARRSNHVAQEILEAVPMKYKRQLEDGYVALVLSGKVMGGPDFERFHGEVKDLVAENHRKFLFDFSKVDWINSTGVGIIVSCYQSIRAADGRLVICGANKRVKNIYYVSQLDKVFETYDDCAAAIAALTES